MDTRSWRPHGLIQQQTLEAAYQDAKMSVDSQGNVTSPKEHFTVSLFEDLFNKVIFPEDAFSVNSQVPPATKPGAEKACDIAIRCCMDDYSRQILCFAEAKRASSHTNAAIRDLEEQARGYCADFLDANPNVDKIFACTLVGTSVRCWEFEEKSSHLQPLWNPAGQVATFSEYLDVGEDAVVRRLEKAFWTMKKSSRAKGPLRPGLITPASAAGQPGPGH
ncbi:hypothetical protein MAPG_10565 [Magnaporthiopsis poae ATCC 64411]|uniref:Type I restriction enzyme R protein N-terminal domain-containing protein n=1 Tax=Magnaporthiopsis poae (strain ATCC 64411 / 73-15) TaxID=644358 RepID=A0A0C4ECX6_MAGP6|nr:hypothetical protein MAPG_10565 [Magnaporthiopsis poae ATCC 64411]